MWTPYTKIEGIQTYMETMEPFRLRQHVQEKVSRYSHVQHVIEHVGSQYLPQDTFIPQVGAQMLQNIGTMQFANTVD